MPEEKEITQGEQTRRSRRAVLKTGAILVPTIVTLHASPAWAETDYTLTAYRYGANAGLCRNPDFDRQHGRGADRRGDPRADRSRAWWREEEEFMPCGEPGSAGGDAGGTTTRAADETIIEF
jgi:hypothetical protein